MHKLMSFSLNCAVTACEMMRNRIGSTVVCEPLIGNLASTWMTWMTLKERFKIALRNTAERAVSEQNRTFIKMLQRRSGLIR